MPALLVAITVLEYFEALNPAVDVLDSDAVPRKAAVESLLLWSQFAFSRLFEGRDAKSVEIANALKAFVTKQKDVRQQMEPALLEQGFGTALFIVAAPIKYFLFPPVILILNIISVGGNFA